MDYDKLFETFKKKVLKFVSVCLYPALKIFFYFVVIGEICLVQNRFKSNTILAIFIVFHMLFIYILVFYLRLLPKDDNSTRNIFYTEPSQGDKQYKNFNPYLSERINFQGKYRKKICKFFLVFKPPRSHHCNACNTCILKMDHHCFFISTCVGFYNYKFFVLFLFYNSLLNVLSIVLLLYEIFKSNTALLTTYIVCAVLISIEFLLCFSLFCYHCLLISRNETTIENIYINQFINGDKPLHHDIFQEGALSVLDKTTDHISEYNKEDRTQLNPYHLTKLQNFYEVFGNNLLLAFTPTFTSKGNGIVFAKNSKEIEEDYE